MCKIIIIIALATLLACPSRYSVRKEAAPQATPQPPQVTYWKNGNKKTEIEYHADGVTVDSVSCYDSKGESSFCHPTRHDLPTAYISVTYHDTPKNTKVANYIHYRDTAKTTILQEYTYWKNGNKKTEIEYLSDGVTIDFAYCYDSKDERSFCHPTRHDLPTAYISVTYHDTPKNTKVASYIHYRDTAKTTILQEYTYWKNGNAKTKIGYLYDGETKDYESTFWKDGNPKTAIEYLADGVAKKEEATYWQNGNSKTFFLCNTIVLVAYISLWVTVFPKGSLSRLCLTIGLVTYPCL